MAEALTSGMEQDMDGLLTKHLLRAMSDNVEIWSFHVTAMTAWEDEHLLDNPTPEQLAKHKWWVNNSLSLGRLLSMSTDNPDFPDRRMAANVAATMEVLRDKLAMFHNPRMSKERSEKILSDCGLV